MFHSPSADLVLLFLSVWFVALPRHVMFYDVVEFIYSHKMSSALCRELPKLLAPPVNQQVHMEHIRILSQYR